MQSQSVPVLLNCPFCDGTAEFVVFGELYRHRVKCKSCGAVAGGSAYKNDNYNANCWNKRVI